jgi:two-component system cell cycle sensor histidine kinase PleC
VGFAKAQKVRAPVEPAPETSPALLAALDCLRTAITMYDSDEKLVYANRHFDYLFRGLPDRASLIGRGYSELVRLEITHGEIAASALIGDTEDFVERRRAQLTSGDYRPLDLTLSDGRIVELKSRRVPEGGWIVLWSDVTAARHAMGRLEDAIALSADAFAFFNRGDRLVVCNKEFAALYGWSLDEIQGKDFAGIVAAAVSRGRVKVDGDREAWIARCLDLHSAPAGAMTLELTSGEAYLLRDRLTRDGGRVTVLTDVTDERRVEAALAEQTGSLQRAQRELAKSRSRAASQATYLADLTKRLDAAAASADTTKKTLLRTMSHELKTPLNAIIGFSDLLGQLADRCEPAQVREYAGLIHAGGQNLLRLINQILDLTRLAGGRFEPRLTRMDVSGALWIAKDLHGERAAAKQIAIDADACPVGLLADVDESAFGQMVNQLFDNALAFAPRGGLIALSAVRTNNRVLLRVADNGPGVATHDLARILEPFEQGGRGTADHTHGAGLGLTLVKAFAELHGGALHLESEAGKGFAATIELPAAD